MTRPKRMPRVGVLDYAMGNLRSVSKSLEAAGARVAVTDERAALERCDVLVLPGQGAFGTAVDVLRRRKLTDFVKGWIREDRPFLGVCLGLQLLFERSEEAPGKRGLGVLPGIVKKFRPGGGRKVPHMGWNEAAPRGKRGDFGFKKPDYFYFVHSYYPAPEDSADVWLETDYGGRFCSAVARGRLAATQFHPEKSADAGRRFLEAVLPELTAGL